MAQQRRRGRSRCSACTERRASGGGAAIAARIIAECGWRRGGQPPAGRKDTRGIASWRRMHWPAGEVARLPTARVWSGLLPSSQVKAGMGQPVLDLPPIAPMQVFSGAFGHGRSDAPTRLCLSGFPRSWRQGFRACWASTGDLGGRVGRLNRSREREAGDGAGASLFPTVSWQDSPSNWIALRSMAASSVVLGGGQRAAGVAVGRHRAASSGASVAPKVTAPPAFRGSRRVGRRRPDRGP